jgi:hypothetical protein
MELVSVYFDKALYSKHECRMWFREEENITIIYYDEKENDKYYIFLIEPKIEYIKYGFEYTEDDGVEFEYGMK